MGSSLNLSTLISARQEPFPAQAWLDFWQRLGDRLVDAVLSPGETGSLAEGWEVLLPDKGDRILLSACFTSGKTPLWKAAQRQGRPLSAKILLKMLSQWWTAKSAVRKSRVEEWEERVQELFPRPFPGRAAPARPNEPPLPLSEALQAWYKAGLTEKLGTETPDFYWQLAALQVWSSPSFQAKTGMKLVQHLVDTTFMNPLPEGGVCPRVAPETLWCLLILAIRCTLRKKRSKWLHVYGIGALWRWWAKLPPVWKFHNLAEDMLAGTAGWAGVWDQFLLTGACLRWHVQPTDFPGAQPVGLRSTKNIRQPLFSLPRLAAEVKPVPPETPQASAWTQENWEMALPKFLQSEGCWRRTFLSPSVPCRPA